MKNEKKSRKGRLMIFTIAILLMTTFAVLPTVNAGEFIPDSVTDQTPTAPLSSPNPSSCQPRYISGFGIDDSFTIFFEDRDAGNLISYVSTTTGPTGFPSSVIHTNIADTHFCVKDYPITIAGTDYNYRAWASVGNNMEHKFYVSNDLATWTLVSTFTIPNAASFTDARGYVYYGFHDVIRLNGKYYAFAESNQGQTMICRSDNGDDVWEAFDSVGGTQIEDGPLQMPESITPSGSFIDLGNNRGFGKLYIRGNDAGCYLAINTAATQDKTPAEIEAAFIDPNNWMWNDGSVGLPTVSATPILSATSEHDVRECWVVPNSDPNADWVIIYDADFGSADGGKALGYATLTPPMPPPTEVWVDDDYTASSCGGHTWGYDAFDNIQDGIDAVSGSTVYVMPGLYQPTSTITITTNNLNLIGPQAGIDPRPFGGTTRIPGDTLTEAVIDGNGINRIIYIDADNVIIDGLEVLDGTGDLIRQSNSHSGTIIRNCIVHDAIDDEGIQLAHCTDGSIEYNYIYDVAQDGANFASSIDCRIYKNEIANSDSENGAIFVYGSEDITIDSNYVHDTTAGNGILLENNGPGVFTISNNLIEHNDWQGGVNSYAEGDGNTICLYKAGETSSIFNLIHNTLVDNTGEDGGNPTGHAIFSYDYKSTGFVTNAHNNIIADHNGYGIHTAYNAVVNYGHNDIYNNAGATDGSPNDLGGNIYVPPQFIGAGDYHLQSSSPCIDTGASSSVTTDIEGNARDANPDMGAYEYVCICVPEVWVDDNAVSAWYDYSHVHTVQEGIDHVCEGGTIHVLEGTYNENVVVDKYLKMIGSGSGIGGSVITQDAAGAGDSHVGVVQIAASGLSDVSPLLFQDIRVEPVGLAGFSIGHFTEATGTHVEYVKFDNVYVVGTNTNPSTEQERGLYVDLTSSLSHFTVIDSAFNDLTYGWYLHKDVSADTSIVCHVTVEDTLFNHNNHKGIYAEKLSDATFTRCVIEENGFDSSALPSYFAPWSAGVDINLKAGTYNHFVFDDCVFTSNAVDEAKEGVGLTVKGRGTGSDSSSYTSYPAYVDDVYITGCTFTNNERGMRFGEPGKDNLGPTNVVVEGNRIVGNVQHYSGVDGSAYGGLVNMMDSSVEVMAECNWWGDCSGPSGEGPGSGDAVIGNADFDPWVGKITVDAGGPYEIAEDSLTVYFHGSYTTSGCCDETVSVEWDFGDGATSTDLNPVHTYASAGQYVVTLTVTTTTLGETCSDVDTTTVRLGGDDPPIIQIITPEDGEIIDGVYTVSWYAIDDDYPGGVGIPIYLYYRPVSSGSWHQIDGVLTNNVDGEHGSYDWDTSGYADGQYVLLAEALDGSGNIAHHSVVVTIGNGNAGVVISDVSILDSTVESTCFVKDGDMVVVTAGVTGRDAVGFSADDITADLSGFGYGSSVTADSFDGFTATWTLSHVVCGPSDGLVSVTVSVAGSTRTATIMADNTAPEIMLVKPTGGLYFYNGLLLPLGRTIVVGPLDVKVSGSDDIARVEFYVDDELMHIDDTPQFEWYMNLKMRGVHELTVIVYDGAGNTDSTSVMMKVFNPFGMVW